MATFRKRGNAWRVEICKHGIRKSGTFDTKAQAAAWAMQVEGEIENGFKGIVSSDKTVHDVLKRYREEITPTKRGARWEELRLRSLMGESSRVSDPMCSVRLNRLDTPDIAAWRDRRLKEVSAGSVLREWNLLSHAFTVAVREWRWLNENPMKLVRRPPQPQPRDRRISEQEIERILLALGYCRDDLLKTQTSRVGAAFLLAIETAMRAGEIVKLECDRVSLDRRYVELIETKNGTIRKVPLSTEAVRIFQQPQVVSREEFSVLQVSSANLDALFRAACKRAGIEKTFTFTTRAMKPLHDLRRN